MQDATHVGHPRPQLTRAGWTDLCGLWEFAYDDDNRGVREKWWRRFPPAREIIVPFPPEAPASGIGDGGFHPVVWYRHQTVVPELGDWERLVLHIGACDFEAQVWCNGEFVGQHRGGHTPFRCDLTDVVEGRDAELVVRAVDAPDDATQPRGKQTWHLEPHRVWYPRTTGIWQPVWLERLPSRSIDSLYWTSDLARGVVGCEIGLAGPRVGGERVAVRLELRGELLAEYELGLDGTDLLRGEVELPILRNGVDRARALWSPESPTLIDATVTVLGRSREPLDVVRSYLGIREVSARDGKFLLNGRPYFLRFALEQGIWPDTHLAAASDDVLRQEVTLAKELGFNGVRVHQKLEDPRFLTWCDRLGLLVWEEMPSCYEFGTGSVSRLLQEWSEAVKRDRSHPCIVCWVPLNESWGVPALTSRGDQRSLALALVNLTRALDPSRPVVSNDGWEHLDSDIVTVHDYSPSPDDLQSRYGDPGALARTVNNGWPAGRAVLLSSSGHAGAPVIVSEFGGLGLTPKPGEPWFGYATLGSANQLGESFANLVAALLDSPGLAGFCYTQLTDTFQETNGLLDANRKPKLPVEFVRKALCEPSRAVPQERVERARAEGRASPDGDGKDGQWGVPQPLASARPGPGSGSPLAPSG